MSWKLTSVWDTWWISSRDFMRLLKTSMTTTNLKKKLPFKRKVLRNVAKSQGKSSTRTNFHLFSGMSKKSVRIRTSCRRSIFGAISLKSWHLSNTHNMFKIWVKIDIFSKEHRGNQSLLSKIWSLLFLNCLSTKMTLFSILHWECWEWCSNSVKILLTSSKDYSSVEKEIFGKCIRP